MALSATDFTKGIDFTALATAAAGDHNTLVDNATTRSDSATEGKGLILWTVDSSLNTPNVPNVTVTTKWARYIWLRIPHASAASNVPLFYGWNTAATSVATFLKWQRFTADTSAIEALITALDLRVDDLEASIATALATANAANATAATASANATSALMTASTANTNALQALSDLNTPTTGIKDRVTSLETRVTNVESQITTINATLITLSTLPALVASTVILESANYGLGSGLFATFAHGLGVKPRYVKTVLVCIALDAATGYVVGDEFPMMSASQTAANPVFGEIVNATNIILTLEPTAVGIWNISHKVTGARTIPTSAANFQAKIYYAKQ